VSKGNHGDDITLQTVSNNNRHVCEKLSGHFHIRLTHECSSAANCIDVADQKCLVVWTAKCPKYTMDGRPEEELGIINERDSSKHQHARRRPAGCSFPRRCRQSGVLSKWRRRASLGVLENEQGQLQTIVKCHPTASQTGVDSGFE
jgi:hypothetical protein